MCWASNYIPVIWDCKCNGFLIMYGIADKCIGLVILCRKLRQPRVQTQEERPLDGRVDFY